MTVKKKKNKSESMRYDRHIYHDKVDYRGPDILGNKKENKIRLAMVRCDTHAYYYGVMIQKCNPMILMETNYIIHQYATDLYHPDIMTVPQVAGFEIVKVWDKNFENAHKFSKTFLNSPKPCKSYEEMAENIDGAFIADCDGSGGDHSKLAEPFLKKGIPTFIDKPFASTLKDARAIMKLARKHNTPVFNASLLSYIPAADQFKRRFDEIGKIGLGVVKGVGGAFSQALAGRKKKFRGLEDRLAYLIHGVSLAMNLFGNDVEWVECMGTLPLEYLHMHLESGMEVFIFNTSVDIFPESCSFFASAYSKLGAIHSGPIGDPEFIYGAPRILEIIKKMVLTKKPPVPYEEFVKKIAIIESAYISQQKGCRVYIKNIFRR